MWFPPILSNLLLQHLSNFNVYAHQLRALLKGDSNSLSQGNPKIPISKEIPGDMMLLVQQPYLKSGQLLFL